MNVNQKTIGVVNQVSILLLENGDKLIPIKPICEALGIDSKSQRDKINDDEILRSVTALSTATGRDEKQYEMVCLPLKYVFGWLFTINPKNVKEEAREAVTQYKSQCYDILFRHFTKYQDFVIDRGNKTDKLLDVYREAQEGFKNARDKMNKARHELDIVRKTTFEQYEEMGDQLIFDFE